MVKRENNPLDLRLSAIVLAAGQSQRMEGRNKLLAEINGRPLIVRVIDTLLLSAVDEIIVITGYDGEQIQEVAANQGVRFIQNDYFESGMSSSLACGLSAVSSTSHGAMICLGDMPMVNVEILDALIEGFEIRQGSKICLPVVQRKRGNPVLWPRQFFPEMLQSRGDTGARWLLQRFPNSIYEISTENEGVLIDVDTKSDLDRIKTVRFE